MRAHGHTNTQAHTHTYTQQQPTTTTTTTTALLWRIKHNVKPATKDTALVAWKEWWRTGAFYKYKMAGPTKSQKRELQFLRPKLVGSPCITEHTRAGGPKCAYAIVSQATFIPVSAK